MFKSFEELTSFAARKEIKMIDFKEMDLGGRWRHLTIPVERFSEEIMKNGIGFDGSSYGFSTIEKSDMIFIPDLGSAFLDPLVEMPTISMIGDIYEIGNPHRRFEGDPRYVAEKTEKYMAQSGVVDQCLYGPEFEFYILDNIEYRVEMNNIEVHLDSKQAQWNTFNSIYDEPGSNSGYKVMSHKNYHADIPFDSSFDLRNTMVRMLEDNGIPVKYHHAENGGPGQVEIEVNFASLKEIGDRAQKLKYFVKNLAHKNGRSVTFMPKPFFGEAGSGMHVHIQMFKNSKPVFYDKDAYSGLSQTALYSIGGILKHSRALTAFTNPSTNSYRRLVPGYEAQVTICFATANRSSVIRIPGYAASPEEKRYEFRPPDASANPYLAFSAITMAALDGILQKIDPIAEGYGPFDKNMYILTPEEKVKLKNLPASLEEAAKALEDDHDFLLEGGVFTRGLLEDQLKRIRKDAEELSIIPHPMEFKKYYDI